MPGFDIYSGWERHKLAVQGLRRGCVAGMVADPLIFVAVLVLFLGGAISRDQLLQVFGIQALLFLPLAAVYGVIRLRGADLRHPFVITTALYWGCAVGIGVACSYTGGFQSPLYDGLSLIALTWALLVPGGARYAAVPLVGSFLLVGSAVLVLTPRGMDASRAAGYAVVRAIWIGLVVYCAEALERWRRRSAQEASTDWLTGAMTRRHVEERMEVLTAQHSRRGAPVSAIMVDIDLFKSINDAHGHSAGDQVLRTVAEAARTLIRRNDILSRFGGDEFLLILEDCDAVQARAVADRLRATVEETSLIFRGAAIPISLSLGVASVSQEQAPDMDALFQAADAALYEDKRARHAAVKPRALP